MKKEKKKKLTTETQRSIFQPPSPPKSRWDPNPAETHEFLQSLCCSVFINSYWVFARACSYLHACRQGTNARLPGVLWLGVCSCHLAFSPLPQSIQHAQKRHFAVWPHSLIWWRCNLSTPDPEMVSKARCFTYDTGWQLSSLQMSFLRNTQEKHFIFPAAVFDFTIQIKPPAYFAQQCDNFKKTQNQNPNQVYTGWLQERFLPCSV